MIIKTAEPFFFPGSKTGCLLVHGFTGTPKEMRWLGEHLADQGHSVLGVRLAAHATQPKDMVRARWRDWLASVEDGWHLLSNTTERVVVIGLSMGGVLALTFAAKFPVAGVVAMATPHHLPKDPRVRFIKPLSFFVPNMPKGPSNWFDQKAFQSHVSYEQDPTRAYAEVRDLILEMRRGLPKVIAPALLIYSKDDLTIRAEDRHMEQMAEELGSQDVQTQYIEGSSHVITRDAQRAQVFELVVGFTNRIHQANQ